jgi:hypothetical protein
MKQIKIQCGYEDECKAKSCLNCPRKMKFKTLNLTLAEAICIEDFADVDLEQWQKEKPKSIDLAQNIMRKLNKRVIWK